MAPVGARSRPAVLPQAAPRAPARPAHEGRWAEETPGPGGQSRGVAMATLRREATRVATGWVCSSRLHLLPLKSPRRTRAPRGLPWEPGRAPPQSRDPQARARSGCLVRMAPALRGHPAQCGLEAARRGGGLGTPAQRQPHLLLTPLSRDGFQLLRRRCRQHRSHHPAPTACPAARPGCRGHPAMPRLRPLPAPRAHNAWCHGGAAPGRRGVALRVPPAPRAGTAGLSAGKRQGALRS